MGIDDEHVGRTDGDPSARASLDIEFRSAERQTIASFRESFLRWLNDRSGPLTRALGAPDRLSLDEVPPEESSRGIQTLRLRVSWPVGRSVPQPVLLRAAAVPVGSELDAVAAPPALPPLDHYVFFPDAPQDEAPLFRELAVPLSPLAPGTTPGAGRLRLERPSGEWLLGRVATFGAAVRSFVRRRAAGVTVSSLTVRMPAFAYPRAGRLAALGTAAVAAGFVAGTVYLTTTGRPAAAPVAQETVARGVPVAAAAALPTALPIPAPEREIAAPVPPPAATERAADADHVERVTPPQPVVSSAADSGIPDTEVTPAPRPRPPVVKPAAIRRAGPMVVSARADAQASVVMVGGRRMLGALLVKSEPQGAEVAINGVVHGRTPLLIRGVGAGSRVVRLALPGYERWSWAVPVAGDKETPVNVKLQPEARGSSDQDH